MWWQYFIVFLGAVVMDITPLPLPPAFTIMILFQVMFGLPVWPVIVVGVAGSVVGRGILSMYIPTISDRIFNERETEDIRFLGNKLNSRGWKSQLFILFYTLMPLPSTPLFIAGGIARMKWINIIPAFCVGKLTSDAVAVSMGKYAAENTASILKGMVSVRSFIGLGIGLLFIALLLFIDWRALIQDKKFRIHFNIWR